MGSGKISVLLTKAFVRIFMGPAGVTSMRLYLRRTLVRPVLYGAFTAG